MTRDVAAAVLDADDVGVMRQLGGRLGQQVHAGERGDVVEDHRRRRGVGHGGVVLQQRLGRDARLEERRRAHHHGVGAQRRRARAGAHRHPHRLAPGAGDQPLLPRILLARGRNHARPTRRRRARAPRRCCQGRPVRPAASSRSGARCGGRPPGRRRRPQRAWSRARRCRAGEWRARKNYINCRLPIAD